MTPDLIRASDRIIVASLDISNIAAFLRSYTTGHTSRDLAPALLTRMHRLIALAQEVIDEVSPEGGNVVRPQFRPERAPKFRNPEPPTAA